MYPAVTPSSNYPFYMQHMYASPNVPMYPNPTGSFVDSIGSVTPFVSWIEDYPLPDGLKMLSHIGSYNGKGDPDNFLHLFKGAIRMQKWLISEACHTFTYTLKDSAHIWWNSQKIDQENPIWMITKDRKRGIGSPHIEDLAMDCSSSYPKAQERSLQQKRQLEASNNLLVCLEADGLETKLISGTNNHHRETTANKNQNKVTRPLEDVRRRLRMDYRTHNGSPENNNNRRRSLQHITQNKQAQTLGTSKAKEEKPGARKKQSDSHPSGRAYKGQHFTRSQVSDVGLKPCHREKG
ncbi:hypothetical protein Tco_1081594 [Tanacetum coccineum]|uniref:Uncharacterized protein n=1 Tax=Tanacetum coccineum TaxID=301880 RepID=A0ABQ5HYX3_9ASTR